MNENYWLRVWVAFLAGCIGAFQIGKSFASLALIILELELSLFQAGLILSLFSLISAFAGLGFGLVSDRIGHLKAALTGLVVSALGSFIGSLAPGIEILLMSRLVEGLGFIFAIVALPSLISHSVNAQGRPLAMGLWSAFMPVGIGASMLMTPLLLEWHGWRGLWNDIGFILLFWAAILFITFRAVPRSLDKPLEMAAIVASVMRPAPLLVVAGFICYSSLYGALTAFLPTMLVTGYGLSVATAAQLGALVVVANALGNIGAGWLIGRGVTPWKLLLLSFVAMGLSASLVYAEFTGPLVKTLAGVSFSALGGLFPGTAFVLAARYSIQPSHMALMAGMLLQGAGIGQTIGPLMVSSLVEQYASWNAAILVVAVMVGWGIMFVFMLSARESAEVRD